MFVLIILLVLILAKCIRIVPEKSEYIIERLGVYHTTWTAGLHFLVPVLDRIACKVNMKEIVLDFEPQPVITKDNVTMQIDTVVYCNILDSKLYTYGVHMPIKALGNLTATTLRNIVGELELDETLTSRDIINEKMRAILDEATDQWGLRVNRVELKNIVPPRDIQEAMEKQMRAERERRAVILDAEGRKRAAILDAEGEKESAILRANAKKEAMIAEAQGQAEAVRTLNEAQAAAIKLINDASPSEAYLKLQSFEAMKEVAHGKATKLIIPSELQDMTVRSSALKEVFEGELYDPKVH